MPTISVPITVKTGKLPLGREFSPSEYRAALLQRIELSLSDRSVILGSSDSSTSSLLGPWFRPCPTLSDGVANSTTTYTSATANFTASDVGLVITGTNIPANTKIASVSSATTVILSQAATATASGLTFQITGRANSWWIRDVGTGSYAPMDIGLLSSDRKFGTLFNADPTANRTITLPDVNHVTALLKSDISVPKETVVLTSSGGTVSTIDASISNNFILTLTENSTIPSLTNMTLGSGNKIRIAIINAGTSYTVTWPSAGANEIKWPSSPSHTQPVASAGQPQAMGIYTITEANLGITPHLWGDPEVSGFSSPGDEIETGGDVPSDYLEDPPIPRGIVPYQRP